MTHSNPKCAQQFYKDCQTGTSLHGENATTHWWSGWPGAYCLKCGAEDTAELCIGECCACSCHDAFWEDYEKYCNEHKD